MTNEIQRIRSAMEREFDPSFIMCDEHQEVTSPCGKYLLVTDVFGTTADPKFPSIVVAIVRKIGTGEVLATIKRNDDRLFFSWVARNNHDYLLFPEDLEGQSVIDLTERRIAGFASEGGDFIWTEFHPSHDTTKLAIVGCYWACPYQVTVYDFREPMMLPLPIICQFDLPGNNARFKEWESAEVFTVIDDQGQLHTYNVS
ncbi:MAG: hypothetical protein KDA86_03715 [Planctomycetaceae bacterium]|nr:hypothetical protein [Planctomycetaceae bacterium]